MNAFEEFMFDENYVLRFYRVDHGLVCTINESMVPELREVESKLRQQQAEIETLKAHPVKDLEDIDINITWNENSMRDFGKDELAFARAILRKAQEK